MNCTNIAPVDLHIRKKAWHTVYGASEQPARVLVALAVGFFLLLEIRRQHTFCRQLPSHEEPWPRPPPPQRRASPRRWRRAARSAGRRRRRSHRSNVPCTQTVDCRLWNEEEGAFVAFVWISQQSITLTRSHHHVPQQPPLSLLREAVARPAFFSFSFSSSARSFATSACSCRSPAAATPPAVCGAGGTPSSVDAVVSATSAPIAS